MISELLPGTRLGTLIRSSQTLLNSKYPNDFEVYMCSLELVSPKTGKTLVYFVFPVMPSSISFNPSNITNVTNTFGGVTVLSSTTFNPFTINLSGNFGKSFKVSLGQSYADISSSLSGSGQLIGQLKSLINSFDNRIKSGYGHIKLLESILEESKKVDENGQRVLYFYNLAFNQKHVVEYIDITYKQDMSTNLVWNYNLNLTAVAPLQSLQTYHSDGRDYNTIGDNLSKEKILNTVGSKVFNTITNLLKI